MHHRVGSVSFHGAYDVTIPVTHGVPFELDFSMTGNVECGASLDLSADYTLTSGQDRVDIPKPSPALLILSPLAWQLRVRTARRRANRRRADYQPSGSE
jgi:hypothetical protein